jgi:uncharacterized protein with HEPN domain
MEPVELLWEQVQRARDAKDADKAIALCQRFLQRSDSSPDHAALGLACCYLGETYRLMGIHRSEEAADAFGNARLHFSMDDKLITSSRNRGIAHWSTAIVYESLPDQWNTALSHFQAASRSIQESIKRAQDRNLDELVEQLKDIERRIGEDHDALQWKQLAAEPKIKVMVDQLEAAERRLEELLERGQQLLKKVDELSGQVAEDAGVSIQSAEEAAQNATKAAKQALYAARAAGSIKEAADNTSRKIGKAAEKTIQETVEAAEQIERLVQRADQESLANSERIERVERVLDRLEQIPGQMQTPWDSDSLLIVPAALTGAARPGDYFAVQRNGNDRETILDGEYEWIAEAEDGPIYHFRRINDQILLVPVEQGKDEERPVQLPGQIVGVLRKVS